MVCFSLAKHLSFDKCVSILLYAQTEGRNGEGLCVKCLGCSSTFRTSEEIKPVVVFNGNWNVVITNKL